jgi:MoxR-like ATPase
MDKNKNCSKCPAFCKPEEAIGKFKKSTGAPMCGRYGHVLGKPGLAKQQEAKIQIHFANTCPSYGDEMPPIPEKYGMEVALGDPDAIGSMPIDPANQEMVKTCSMCKNFVRDDAVASELGWTTGLCAAKGRLILTNRQVFEAKGCVFREYGAIRSSTAGIHLLPVYEEAFNLETNPIRAYFDSKKYFVEPHEWETEKVVTDADRAAGIRAWRRIVDPDGSDKETFLPVYDPEHFDEVERAKIPRTGDDEHPELYIDHFGGTYLAAVAWQELDETPALWGESGTGKTELFRYLAWLMCLPLERVNITAQTEIDDIAGKLRFDPEEGTYFQYGRLPLAWGKPCVLGLDEPNVAEDPAVWHFIRPLTDNSKQMVLDMNTGEKIARNPDCYFGLAMNPAWDPRNVGAMEVSDADVNRLFHVFVELPPPELEREIIKSRVRLDGWEIDNDWLNMLMKIADEIRGLSKEGTIPVSWAIRPQIKVARALRWFEPVMAYRRAVADYLEPEAAAALLDVVRAHVPQ